MEGNSATTIHYLSANQSATPFTRCKILFRRDMSRAKNWKTFMSSQQFMCMTNRIKRHTASWTNNGLAFGQRSDHSLSRATQNRRKSDSEFKERWKSLWGTLEEISLANDYWKEHKTIASCVTRRRTVLMFPKAPPSCED